jgi:hypothetical protein
MMCAFVDVLMVMMVAFCTTAIGPPSKASGASVDASASMLLKASVVMRLLIR